MVSGKIRDGDFSFEQIGTLELAKTQAHLDELRSVKGILSNSGVVVDMMNQSEITDHNISADRLLGGLHLPGDGVLDPAEIVQFFTEEARKEGVQIGTDVEVRDISRSGQGG